MSSMQFKSEINSTGKSRVVCQIQWLHMSSTEWHCQCHYQAMAIKDVGEENFVPAVVIYKMFRLVTTL